MGNYTCDTCAKSFKYKRNLKRHVEEKHIQMEHWNCVVKGCTSKFIRRSYLSVHLTNKHGMTRVESRRATLEAKRGDALQNSYYDDVSEDDSILDIIAQDDDAVDSSETVDTASSVCSQSNSGGISDETSVGDDYGINEVNEYEDISEESVCGDVPSECDENSDGEDNDPDGEIVYISDDDINSTEPETVQTISDDANAVDTTGGHGHCSNTAGSYTCTCTNGWTGRNCENDIDECSDIHMCKNGQCHNTNGSYTCNCDAGWTGWQCDVCSGSGLCQHHVARLEDTTHVSCNTSSWHIVVDLDLLKNLYPEVTARNLFLGSSRCLGSVVNGTRLVFNQDLQDCQTSEQASSDVLLYKNELVYAIFDPINPFIIRQHKWSLTVKCDVVRNVTASSHVHHHVHPHEIEVTTQYSISLTYYRDPEFQHTLAGNEIDTGDSVYVKVSAHAETGVNMRVHTCFTKPSDDAPDQMKYFIIQNGCAADGHTRIISQVPHETRFVFQDFEYASDREGLSVFCSAVFCKANDQSPRCNQVCQSHAAIIG